MMHIAEQAIIDMEEMAVVAYRIDESVSAVFAFETIEDARNAAERGVTAQDGEFIPEGLQGLDPESLEWDIIGAVA